MPITVDTVINRGIALSGTSSSRAVGFKNIRMMDFLGKVGQYFPSPNKNFGSVEEKFRFLRKNYGYIFLEWEKAGLSRVFVLGDKLRDKPQPFWFSSDKSHVSYEPLLIHVIKDLFAFEGIVSSNKIFIEKALSSPTESAENVLRAFSDLDVFPSQIDGKYKELLRIAILFHDIEKKHPHLYPVEYKERHEEKSADYLEKNGTFLKLGATRSETAILDFFVRYHGRMMSRICENDKDAEEEFLTALRKLEGNKADILLMYFTFNIAELCQSDIYGVDLYNNIQGRLKRYKELLPKI